MSERIYGWLLRLYPRAFREEYGAAARQLFHDCWSSERGLVARWRLWWDVLGDLAVSIPREHRRPASPKPVSGYRLSEEAVDAMPASKHSLSAVYLALVASFTLGLLGGALRTPLLIGYVLLALPLTVAHLRQRVRARQHLLSIELFLEPDRIERKQPGFDVTLRRSEITRVFEMAGGLIVSGPDRKTIWVPRRLNGYQQVRDHLAGWLQIESEEPTHHSVRLKPRYAQIFLFPFYVSALLVRSPAWSIALALPAIAGLLVMARGALRRPPEMPLKWPPVLIMLGLVAALIVKNILLFR